MYSFSPVEYSGGFVGVALHGTLIPQGIAGVTSNTLLKRDVFADIACIAACAHSSADNSGHIIH